MIDKLGNVSAFNNIKPIAFCGTKTNPISEQKPDAFELTEKEVGGSSDKTK